MQKILLIAIGGAIGAVARYVLSGIPYKFLDPVFPYGTLLVNLTGAYIIGVLFALSERIEISSDIRFFVFIGILGAFTTFSTFALETVNLVRDREVLLGLWNFIITNFAGILAVFLGFFTTRVFFKVFHLLHGR